MERTTTTLAVIDWQLAEELMNGNQEEARNLIKQLVADLPQTLTAIKQALKARDYQTLLTHTHRLHGACCYCEVPVLKQYAKALEKALRYQQVSDVPTLALALERQIKALLKYASTQVHFNN